MSPEIKRSEEGYLLFLKPETKFGANVTSLGGQAEEEKVIRKAAEATGKTPKEIARVLKEGETVSW